jgi:hypothetical protein
MKRQLLRGNGRLPTMSPTRPVPGGAIKDVPCLLRRECIDRHVYIVRGEPTLDRSMPWSARRSRVISVGIPANMIIGR